MTPDEQLLRHRPALAAKHAETEADLKTDERSSTTISRATLMGLPQEIHALISKELIYPDALSLKHTNRHFYGLVDTGVKLKVAWLVERRMLHLDCPNDRRCVLNTDSEFCRGRVTYVIPQSPASTRRSALLGKLKYLK